MAVLTIKDSLIGLVEGILLNAGLKRCFFSNANKYPYTFTRNMGQKILGTHFL
ncbi:MAG: hypothetical protein JW801_07250 [Bacteroidales bacterium]|nr:hypothetical protein [Bacteroidales bacterium]